jgi:hypothetical protein
LTTSHIGLFLAGGTFAKLVKKRSYEERIEIGNIGFFIFSVAICLREQEQFITAPPSGVNR